MLWESLGMVVWFSIVVAASGFVGRVAKAAWSTMPPLVLPGIALASGYLMLFVDLALEPSAPLSVDATTALWGVLLGGAATAGHELAKKLLEGLLVLVPGVTAARATEIAEVILGKLEERATPPATAKRATQALLLVALLALAGCSSTPTAKGPEVLIVDAFIGAVDNAVPRLAQLEQREGLDAIAKASSREEAVAELAAVRERWAPVWAGIDAIEATHAAYIEGGSPLELLKGLHGRYCETRELTGARGVELPDVPLMPCGEGSSR